MAKILVVDDDLNIVRAIQLALQAASHEVATASSGEEALRKIPEVAPDLIVLDVMMETDTAGFQTAYQIRQAPAGSPLAPYAQVPIIMTTGVGQETGMQFSPETDQDFLPVDAFVEKPVQAPVLLEKIKELLSDR